MALEALLHTLRNLLGPFGVIEDPARIEAHVVDQRDLLRGVTPAVLRPRAAEEVAAIVGIARQHGFGLVAQGGNTSYCGGATPDRSGRQLVVSFERMARIREIDPLSMCISVDAGAVLRDVQDAAAAAGMLLPLSLGAEGSCRIGGNIGTNAGGLSVLRYGMTRDLVLGLEVVLADGTIVSDMTKLRKNNTGYDIKQCMIGSEGTLGLVTGAVLKLFPAPVARTTAWIGLAEDVALPEMLALVRRDCADLVSSFEYISPRALRLSVDLQPEPAGLRAGPGGVILMELSTPSSRLDLDALAEAVFETALQRGWVDDAVIAQSGRQRAAMWSLRESIPEGEKRHGGSIKHDISVPVSAIDAFIEQGAAAVRAFDPDVELSVYGHVGDGNLHYNVLVPRGAERLNFSRTIEERLSPRLYDISRTLGGTFSAEHGVGRLKLDLLERYGDPGRLNAMRRLKAAFDPDGLLNAGSTVPRSPT